MTNDVISKNLQTDKSSSPTDIIKILLQEIQQKNSHITELKDQLDQLYKSNEHISSKLDRIETKYDDLKAQNKTLDSTNNILVEENQGLHKKCYELGSRVQDLEKNMVNIKIEDEHPSSPSPLSSDEGFRVDGPTG